MWCILYMQARYAFIKVVRQGMSYVVGHVAVVRPRPWKRSCELQRPLGSETGTSRLSSKRWKRGTEPKWNSVSLSFCQILSTSFSRKKITVSHDNIWHDMILQLVLWLWTSSQAFQGQWFTFAEASKGTKKQEKEEQPVFGKLVQADVRCALQRRSFR